MDRRNNKTFLLYFKEKDCGDSQVHKIEYWLQKDIAYFPLLPICDIKSINMKIYTKVYTVRYYLLLSKQKQKK